MAPVVLLATRLASPEDLNLRPVERLKEVVVEVVVVAFVVVVSVVVVVIDSHRQPSQSSLSP